MRIALGLSGVSDAENLLLEFTFTEDRNWSLAYRALSDEVFVVLGE
ncbi:hypothetical protein [Streptomyces rubiginosohelvolus]